jgi:hypothetical protein
MFYHNMGYTIPEEYRVWSALLFILVLAACWVILKLK